MANIKTIGPSAPNFFTHALILSSSSLVISTNLVNTILKSGKYEIAGNHSYKEKYRNPEGPVLRCLRSFFSSIGH